MTSNRLSPAALQSGLLALAIFGTGLLAPEMAKGQCAITHAQKFGAPDPSTNRWFGSAIAIDGDVAFIGSLFDDYLCPEDPDCDAGSAHVFTRVAGAWAPAQRLTADPGQAGEFFGCSIAVNGDRALIGGYGRDGAAGLNQGRLYDFRFNGVSWVQHRVIEPLYPQEGAWFGWSVAIEGDLAAVGAINAAGFSGAVYIFRFSNGEWLQEEILTSGVGGGFAIFGASVAIDGGRIVVGASNDGNAGSVTIYHHNGASWVQDQKLTAPLGSSGNRFGQSVAIRGSLALVGDTNEDGGVPNSGAVHAYRFDGQSWVYAQRLVPSNPRADAFFGVALQLGDGVAVIGAQAHDEAGDDAGEAYAFTLDGAAWTQAARLRPAEVDEHDRFGSAVAIEGSEVMIGAVRDDDPCGGGVCGAGAVYVFRPLANCNANAALDVCEIQGGQAQDCNANGIPDACDIASGASTDCNGNGVPDACDLLASGDCNGNGVPDDCDVAQGTSPDCNGNGLPDACDPYAPPAGEQKLVAPAPAASDNDGSAVAVLGDLAVSGAPIRDAQGVDSGVAYVWRRAGGAWSHEATLVGSDITSFDSFGCSVAAERDLVLVGAYAAPTGNAQCGAVYAYRLQGGSWVETAKIIPPVPQSTMHFGYAVAACGDLLIVGSPMESEPGFSQRGAAYLFRFDGAAWVQEAKLLAPVFAAGDQFGYSVAIDGDVAIVGERFDDDVNNNSGAAHVFRFDGQSWVHEAKLTHAGGAAFDYLGYSVSVSGDRAAVGALRGTVGAQPVGTVDVYRHDAQAWVLEATLTSGAPQALSWFGCSTTIVGTTVLVGAYNADVGPVRSGAAYLFEHDGAQWTPRGQFASSDLALSDQLGFAAAFDGQSLSVGAPSEDGGGNAAGASYFFEVPVGLPRITRQPSSLRIAAGAGAAFVVSAVGSPPLTYRWQKNQQDLLNGNGVSGATSSRLVLAAGHAEAGLYRCVVTSGCGVASSREATLFVNSPLGVTVALPGSRLEFAGNRPNPFRGSTRIEFSAPGRGHVTVEIYGLRGELVTRLLDGEVAPGSNAVSWQGTDARGTPVASGVYVCRISGFGQERMRRLTLIR